MPKNPSDSNTKTPSAPDRLMAYRTVMLGKITPEAIHDLIGRLTALQLESSKPIKMLIDSGGGNISSALNLCDFMTNIMTAPVHATAIGNCSSAATFVMMHCAVRQSTPHTRFVIHSGRTQDVSFKWGETTENDLRLLLERSRKLTNMIVKLYMKKLDKSQEEVEALIARGDQDFDNEIFAPEAVEIGLIERVLEDNVGIFPSDQEESTE